LAGWSLIGPAQTNFLRPSAYPELLIKAVVLPTNTNQLPRVVFQMKSIGTTPIALTNSQIAFAIMRGRWQLVALCSLTNGLGTVVAVPGEPVVTAAGLRTDGSSVVDFGVAREGPRPAGTVMKLTPGRYRIRIDIGSERVAQLDYQYLGMTHSPDFEFEVPP
jgi:hypothetical protein